LRLSDGLDGHIVQGHVDGVAAVRNIRRGAAWDIEFSISPELAGQLVQKGSVAVNGVSLTITHVSAGSFVVGLIPTTLSETNLTDLQIGDMVNIETDVIGKYVLRYLANLKSSGNSSPAGKLTIDRLMSEGF